MTHAGASGTAVFRDVLLDLPSAKEHIATHHAYNNGPCMLASEENCRYRVGLCTVTLNLT